jgi:RNA polymerase sigma-70 factor (ECF subfamily)
MSATLYAFPTPSGKTGYMSSQSGEDAAKMNGMSNIIPMPPIANGNQPVAATGEHAVDLADDFVLMQQVAGGSEAAFRQLMRRHADKAVRYCYRLLSDQASAEDQVQQAFMKVWTEAPRWRPEAKFTTWFYRILHNQSIDQLRLRRRPMVEIDNEDVAEQLVDKHADTEGNMADKQRAATVNEALKELPERQRQALILSHYEGFTQREAAGVLGITESALESLLTRGRAALRQKLLHRKGDLI